MHDDGSVLILTDRFDPTADKVVEELNDRGAFVFRFDVAEFPEALTASGELVDRRWTGTLRTSRRQLHLDAVSGIYYRRPTRFDFHPEMNGEERRWAGVQARLGFGGLLAAAGPWLNHPHSIGYAEYKPAALQAAASCGLAVPRTLVSNDPDQAQEFVTALGGEAICKPFGGYGVTDPDGYRHVFASLVSADQCAQPNFARSMHLLQRVVPKDYEVRLTVVDDRFFASRIDAHSAAARVDWRADYHALSYTPIPTPQVVRTRVSGLLTELGLRFAAMDFIVDFDSEWWHVDLNPNGQWGWIEEETGMPIASAIADALDGSTARAQAARMQPQSTARLARERMEGRVSA